MIKKENKNNIQVVKDMKECFRSFHLPINKNDGGKDFSVVFTSQICNDHVCAFVAAIYYKQTKYVAIKISFRLRVPSEKFADMWRLLNRLNSMMPLYHYSICTCCNSMSLEGGIFVSEDCLPISKYKNLIHDLLEDSYLCIPLIIAVIKGGNPDELYYQFIKDHQDILKKENSISKDIGHKIISDVETVLAGMQIKIEAENKHDGCFMNILCPEGTDFFLRMGIRVSHDDKMAILNLAPSFIVPDEKIPVMTEFVGRINEISRCQHMFIDMQCNRVNLCTGIMIVDGIIDKNEFELAINAMMAGGFLFFPIIKDLILSNESLETLVTKICGIAKCDI